MDVQAKEYTNIVRSHTDTVLDMAMDASNKYLATCSLDGSVRVWSMDDTCSQLYYFNEPNEKPCRVCFQPPATTTNDKDRRIIFACGFGGGGSGGKLRLFNVTDAKLHAELRSPHVIAAANNHSSSCEITDIVYTSDAKRLLCADSLKHLTLYNVEREYALVRVLHNAAAAATSRPLALSPDDRYVAAIAPPGQSVVSIFESTTLNEALRINLAECDAAVRLVFTCAEINHLLCATASGKLMRFDARTGRLLSTVNNIHRQSVDFIAVSNDGQYLVTSGDNFIKVWDYQMRLDTNFQVRSLIHIYTYISQDVCMYERFFIYFRRLLVIRLVSTKFSSRRTTRH